MAEVGRYKFYVVELILKMTGSQWSALRWGMFCILLQCVLQVKLQEEKRLRKKQVYYTHRLYRLMLSTPCRTTWEGCLGGQEAGDRSERKASDQSLSWSFRRKGTGGKGEQFRLASLNYFCGLLVTEVVCSCLVPGPEMIKREKCCLLGFVGQREEARRALHWLVCLSKTCATSAVSKNWQLGEGSLSAARKVCKMSKHPKTHKI